MHVTFFSVHGHLMNGTDQHLHMREVQRALDTVTENSVSNTAATLELMQDLHKKALCSSDQVVYTNGAFPAFVSSHLNTSVVCRFPPNRHADRNVHRITAVATRRIARELSVSQ